MSIDPLYVISGIIFLCSLLLFEGIYYLILDKFGARRGANRRMRMLSAGTNAREVFTKLRRASQSRWEQFGSVGALLTKLNRLIMQAGLTISTQRMILLMCGISVASLAGVMFVLARNPGLSMGQSALMVASVVAAVVGGVAPIVYLMFLKSRRLKEFGAQLPDALDMMVRSLRAGHPVGIALALSAKQMPDPIGTELGIAVDEMTYGLELREALANVGKRVGLQDFQFVVVAISIQHDTGGNLAEVLGGLATVIRARFRMFQKVKALTAEGRFSAKFLAGLPFAFLVMVYSSKPSYYLNQIDDPLFAKMMGAALGLQIIGMFVMRKMINFKV